MKEKLKKFIDWVERTDEKLENSVLFHWVGSLFFIVLVVLMFLQLSGVLFYDSTCNYDFFENFKIAGESDLPTVSQTLFLALWHIIVCFCYFMAKCGEYMDKAIFLSKQKKKDKDSE